MDKIFDTVNASAKAYHHKLNDRRVWPDAKAIKGLEKLDVPLQEKPKDPLAVVKVLNRYGSPATVASTGGRFFGFVTGASLPAAMGANMLAGSWDQNGAYKVLSPVNAVLEEIASRWLLDILNLPTESSIGFVTGATMANFTSLASARHAVLEAVGWNIEDKGLFGAPPIQLIVGDEVHASVIKAIRMLGLGSDRMIRVPADGQGRFIPGKMPKIKGPAIVCLQAGNVNTGAFDPFAAVIEKAKKAGAWVHVDGAFGLWALASPHRQHLSQGLEGADSWALDAHKWLNVPQDSGLAVVRNSMAHRAAMAATAAYLITIADREPCHFTPEMSRRARGIEIWAALRSLGRQGITDLIERNCRQAQMFAEGLALAGYKILNDVVLNQVLVSFGTPEQTNAVIKAIQQDGTCWCGGTVWQGQTAMRISVSSWATTDEDVEKSLGAILKLAEKITR